MASVTISFPPSFRSILLNGIGTGALVALLEATQRQVGHGSQAGGRPACLPARLTPTTVTGVAASGKGEIQVKATCLEVTHGSLGGTHQTEGRPTQRENSFLL